MDENTKNIIITFAIVIVAVIFFISGFGYFNPTEMMYSGYNMIYSSEGNDGIISFFSLIISLFLVILLILFIFWLTKKIMKN